MVPLTFFYNINLKQFCVLIKVTQGIILLMLSFCHDFAEIHSSSHDAITLITVYLNAAHSLCHLLHFYCFAECHYVEFFSMVATTLAVAAAMTVAVALAIALQM